MDPTIVVVLAVLVIIVVIAVLFRERISVLWKGPGDTSLSVEASNKASPTTPGAVIAESWTEGGAKAEANPGEQAVIRKVIAKQSLEASTRTAPPSDHPKV